MVTSGRPFFPCGRMRKRYSEGGGILFLMEGFRSQLFYSHNNRKPFHFVSGGFGMDKKLALDFVGVTELAAIASAEWIGKGDKHAADKAATEAMRKSFNELSMDGTIVIGEGERDEAPMLFIGEKVGTGQGPAVDIAVDPLECTNSVAYARPNAIAVLAAGPAGTLLHAPDTYMDKITVGPQAKGAIDIDASVSDNLAAIAAALDKPVGEVTVIVLDRDRHKELVARIREAGARIKLIPDGDISGAMAPCLPDSGIDVLMGVGAAPEGVIGAVAVGSMGGDMQTRMKWRSDEDRQRAAGMGFKKLDEKLQIRDMVATDDAVFVATGVLSGPLAPGVEITNAGIATHSLVIDSKSGIIRRIETRLPPGEI